MRKWLPSSLVALCLALALMVTGCGGSTTTRGGSDTSPGKATSPVNVGAPVYTGTNPEEVYSGVYKMVTPDGFEQVVAFYEKELPNAAFTETTIETGKGASFLVDTSSFHGNVSVEENVPAKGQVTITISRINTQ